jgi:hypothetical protein
VEPLGLLLWRRGSRAEDAPPERQEELLQPRRGGRLARLVVGRADRAAAALRFEIGDATVRDVPAELDAAAQRRSRRRRTSTPTSRSGTGSSPGWWSARR